MFFVFFDEDVGDVVVDGGDVGERGDVDEGDGDLVVVVGVLAMIL